MHRAALFRHFTYTVYEPNQRAARMIVFSGIHGETC